MPIQHPFADVSSTRPIPAWAMSALLHMTVVVLLAWLWKSAPAKGGGGEPVRRAGIVVAVQSQGTTEYFDESDMQAADESATATGASPANPADAMPSLDQTPELPNIQLPGAVQGEVAGNLLDGPNLGMRGGGGLPAADQDALIKQLMADEAALRPPPPIGLKAPLTIFGSPSVGRSFVFVIDRSKSMGASGLGVLSDAQKELTRALGALTPSQRFEIVAYHQSPVTFGEKYYDRAGLQPVDEKNLTRVKEFFNGLTSFGSTQHVYALHAAMNLRPEVIYLLTDGGDPFPSPGQMRELRLRAERQGIAIHCIQFGFGPLQEENNFMMQLSRDTGSFRYQRVRGRP